MPRIRGIPTSQLRPGSRDPKHSGDASTESEIQKCRLQRRVFKRKKKKKRNWSVPTRGGRGHWDAAEVYRLVRRLREGHERSYICRGVQTMRGGRMQLLRGGTAWPATGSRFRTRHFWLQGAVGGVTYTSARTTRAGKGVAQRAGN